MNFAAESPKSWAKVASALKTPDSPVSPVVDYIACEICGSIVAKQGYGAHCARSHLVFRLARAFCSDNGRCPVCSVQFARRVQCIHHVHYSSPACLAALMSGHYDPLHPDEVIRLDALDAQFKRTELKAGRSFLAVH